MKCTVTTLNAKYIHQSLALRLLYVANRDRGVTFREFTIKESVESIARELLAGEPDVIGVGVYIWNVEKVGQLICLLKELAPEVVVIVGGPEVSYEPEYFLDAWPIDYLISGEGEFVLGELLDAIEQGRPKEIRGVSSRGAVSREVVQADLERIARLSSPYTLSEDVASLGNRMIYFETSRGCPYQCQYCLSSLERGVRYLPKEYIFENLEALIRGGARKIKFLDRTFNLDMGHTMAIFEFLIKNYRSGLSCQFEVYADILTAETIDYLNLNLPDDYFRFEIGIQSTHQPTNEAIKRHQNFDVLSSNIRRIMAGGKIDLHLDLIAGLPHETFELFVRSFDEVFEFRAKELQLGFLKMLRGTNLRRDAARHGYDFDRRAPYQVVGNNYISDKELERIHDLEQALDKFWNSGRFPRTMNALLETSYRGRYFAFFDDMGQYYGANNLPHRGYQLEDLFRSLQNFLQQQGIDLTHQMRADYYDCFDQRPNNSFLPTIEKSLRKRLIETVCADANFLSTHGLTHKIVRKRTALDLISSGELLLTVFGEPAGELPALVVAPLIASHTPAPASSYAPLVAKNRIPKRTILYPIPFGVDSQ